MIRPKTLVKVIAVIAVLHQHVTVCVLEGVHVLAASGRRLTLSLVVQEIVGSAVAVFWSGAASQAHKLYPQQSADSFKGMAQQARP